MLLVENISASRQTKPHLSCRSGKNGLLQLNQPFLGFHKPTYLELHMVIIVNDCYSEWSPHSPPHPSVPHAKLLQAFSRILYCKLRK